MWGLVEGHADPLLLAPDDVTGYVRSVCLKDKVETLGNVVRFGNIERLCVPKTLSELLT